MPTRHSPVSSWRASMKAPHIQLQVPETDQSPTQLPRRPMCRAAFIIMCFLKILLKCNVATNNSRGLLRLSYDHIC